MFHINVNAKTTRLALMGVMLAVIITLSYFEHTLPQLPFFPPNFRFGLSNIVTMYCFFFVGKTYAVTLNTLKSLFVLFMRGPFAAVLSLAGGMLSIVVMLLLVAAFGDKISYVMVSVCGAVAHNLGQTAMASVIVKTNIFLAYLPVLLISGIVMGVLTGLMLKIIIPLCHNILKS